jgi:hypothetical protein
MIGSEDPGGDPTALLEPAASSEQAAAKAGHMATKRKADCMEPTTEAQTNKRRATQKEHDDRRRADEIKQ